MAEPVLQVENLVNHFPGSARGEIVHAVNGVSFSIASGETVGLVGESGSGKSTIGSSILRLITPTSGRIVFDGTDITRLSQRAIRPLRGRIQIVFQDPYGTLNPRMRVGTLIGEMLKLHTDLGTEARRNRVSELAGRVRLSADLLTRFPSELSGGQLQRVSIARALATNPKLIILDEPTSSLDLSVRAGILELLVELQRDIGVAMLFISHDLETVDLVSHRILVLYLGIVVEEGPTAAVFKSPQHPYTQSLMSAHLPPDPNEVLSRHILEGEVPSPINLPQGCVFAPRCPVAAPKCSEARPAMESVGEAHQVACIRVREGANIVPAAKAPMDDVHAAFETAFIGRTQ